MSGMPFAFGMNEFTTQPWSFERDLREYADLGVQAIELCEAKLAEGAAGRDQLEALRDSGLPVCSVQPAVRTAVPSAMQPSPKGADERIAAYRASLQRLAPVAPGAVFVTNTGPAPDGDMHRGLEEAVRFHRELAPVAADLGVRLAVEPLNPISLNAETMIWTFAQAVELIERTGVEGLGLCLDTWNLWQDPLLEEGIRSHGELISILQVSDWRTPRSGMDRRSVGTGPIPTGRLLHALAESGYTGACVVEIFSQGVPDSLYDGDLRALIRQNRAALDEAWERAA